MNVPRLTNMYYNNFKGLKISALGYGGLRFPTVAGSNEIIDREASQKLIDMAIENGINYFDTAYTYNSGDSESFLGEALSRHPRDRYYIATKFYVEASRDIDAVFTQQLQRLRTDCIDFYLLHCLDEDTFSAYTDKNADYIGYLKRQKQAGRIKYIGFSSHASPDTLKKFVDMYDCFDMALMQLNYVDRTLLDAAEQYDILTAHGIPVWVMEPMKGGRLSVLDKASASVLKTAAPERSISSWGFRFLMGLPNVVTVLSGMSSEEQIKDNLATFSRRDPLTADENAVLDRAADLFIKNMGQPCSACRYCCPTCPAQLDIPLLIRGYNELTLTGETWRMGALSLTKSASECLQCGECLRHCPQKINIPEIMKKLS